MAAVEKQYVYSKAEAMGAIVGSKSVFATTCFNFNALNFKNLCSANDALTIFLSKVKSVLAFLQPVCIIL
jgi:hypothetical protein